MLKNKNFTTKGKQNTNMKHTFKKILALFMCLISLLSFVPAVAFADEEPFQTTVTIESEKNNAFDYLEYYSSGKWKDLNTPKHWVESTGQVCYCIEHTDGNPHGATYTATAPSQVFGANTLVGLQTILMYGYPCNRSKSHSVSFSQILPRDYDYDEAAVVMAEMAIHGCLELYKRHVITSKVWIGIGYSRHEDYPPAQASIKLKCPTQLSSIIEPAVKDKFREIVARGVPIRNLAISFCDTRDEGCEGYDLFTDWEKVDREKKVERTVLEVRDKYGKNAVLRAINLNKAGTQRERNEMIGGHRAGYDERKPR